MTASSSSDIGDLEKAISQPSGITHFQGYSGQNDSQTRSCSSTDHPSQCCHAGSRELCSGFRHCQHSTLGQTDEVICTDLAEADTVRGEQLGAVDRVLSMVASRSSYDPGPPPDGGWVAWTQCKLNNARVMK